MSAVLIDLLIAATIALCIYLGWKKGMVRSLLALAATIVAIFAASQISDFATEYVINEMIRPAAETSIEERLQEIDKDIVIVSPIQELENVIDAIESDLVREKAYEVLDAMELSNMPIVVTTRDDLSEASRKIVDTVLTGPVQDIISAVVSLICFALISFALQPVIWLVEQAFRLPLLRQVNQIGGLFSGAVKGILIVLIAVWALRMMQLYITDDVIEQSVLLKFAAECLDSLGFGTTVIL